MLRNAPIRTKLIASLLGPLLVLSILALVGIRQNQAESARAEHSTAFARLAAGLAPLVHELQAERSLSTSYIDSDRKAWGQRLAEQRRRLDRVAASYRASAERLSSRSRGEPRTIFIACSAGQRRTVWNACSGRLWATVPFSRRRLVLLSRSL